MLASTGQDSWRSIDQGREMARHAEITQKMGTAIYFCDQHSPWQRGSNENINDLIRQYLPKSTDLSGYTQEQLDAIAYELNIRPRQRFNYRCPIEVITDVVLQNKRRLDQFSKVLHSESATAQIQILVSLILS